MIDDYQLVARALTDVLTGEGHQVVMAFGGEEGIAAVQSAQASGDPFGLVITDFSMKDVDGLVVAAAVKQASPSAGVILITAYRLAPEDPLPPHVDLLLTKPPTLQTLRSALARWAPVG